MSQSKVDWSVLRGAIGVFAICILVGGTLVGVSHYFHREMETDYRNHHSRFREVSRKYLAVDEEEKIVEANYPRFVQLYESGILGQEHRLSWVESLRESGKRIELPEIDYQVNSQTLYNAEFPVELGAFDIYVSEMTLSLGLLHEGDLFELLGALEKDAAGLYSVSQCEANRVNEGVDFNLSRPTIMASCRLNWFTVDLKGEGMLSL